MKTSVLPSPPTEPVYLPVSSVAEILYCPRNFYYRVVEGATEENVFVIEGKLQEERRNERERVIREDSLQIKSIMIGSEELRLVGVVDAIEYRDGLCPVEFKRGPLRDNVNDDVQLAAQAMLIEEHAKLSVDHGYIYYSQSRTRRQVNITPELRELVLRTVDVAFQIQESGTIPVPVLDARCNGCSLAPRCLPEEIQYLKGQGKKPSKPLPSINLGRVLYLDEPGLYLGKRGERLVVSKDKKVLADIPLCNVDEVVLVGAINASGPVVKLLLDHGIPLNYITSFGRYRGTLKPAWSKNSPLRLSQYQAYLDPTVRVELARRFVWGKVANMRTQLLRANRTRKSAVITKAIERLQQVVHLVRERELNLGTLLGLEGSATREYFQVFNELLKSPLEFSFPNRNRRPPRDPVNALLSFGYALLTKDILSAIEMIGFDPYLGFYHEAKYGRPALALDVMEEFRPLIVDSMVISALNKNVFSPEEFEQRLGACFLTDPARRRFYDLYETRRKEMVTHPIFGYRLPYIRIFELQARFLAKVVQGELTEYKPFLTR